MSEHIGAAAGRRLVVFLFTILALFFMYRDGDSLAASLGRLSERAFGPRGRAIGERIVVSVHGTVDGLVLVGLGEGLVLTIAYYFAGVPQVLLMGVATAIGCIIPFGAFVMFSIASLLLIYKGAIFAALFIFALGLVVLTIADHVVRPYVIGNATRLPFLFVLVGILGGVEAFGMLGLFLGPAIMAILVDLVARGDELTRLYGNSPRASLAVRTRSTPIAIAAVRLATPSVAARSTTLLQERSSARSSRSITSSSTRNIAAGPAPIRNS